MKTGSCHQRQIYFFRQYLLQQQNEECGSKYPKVIFNVQDKFSDLIITLIEPDFCKYNLFFSVSEISYLPQPSTLANNSNARH